MYLFIFSILLVVFQYANSKSILDKYEEDIKVMKTKLDNQKQTIATLEDENFELKNFTIKDNEEALTYFEKQGYDVTKLVPAITDGLYDTNNYKGEDHPIVPYVSMTDAKLLINTVRVLNHKWIIANFSDGEYLGEVFLTYNIDENNELQYTLKEYFMYPKAY